MSSQIPLPPLSAVADSSLRNILQAIYDELRLRRGEVGNGQQQHVTRSEFDAALKTKQDKTT